MRLIKPQRTGQQSLGRNDSSVTAEAGKVDAISTATKGVSSSLESLSGASEKILATNTNRQKQQSELFLQKADAEINSEIGGREFFDVTEVDDELVTDGMMVKGRVAAAEVYPQMYASRMKTALEDASKIIENEPSRKDWMVGADKVMTGRQTAIQMDANGKIEKQIFVDQKINYDNAMDADKPDVAMRIAQQMEGKPKVVEELLDSARRSIETKRYKEYMIEGNIEGVYRSIEFLEQDSKTYTDSIGQLNDEERLAWLGKLNGYLAGIKASNTAQQKANARMLKYEVGVTRANESSGIASNVENSLELLQRVRNYNAINEDKLNVEEAKLVKDIGFNGVNNRMLLMERSDRVKFIKENKLKLPGFEADELNGRLQKSHEALTTLENSNAMKAAENAGFFGEEGLEPIDFNASPDELALALKRRSNQFDKMQANYGENMGDGIFDNDNVPSHSALINGKTTTEKARIFAAINDQFGRQSDGVFKQLGLIGNAKTFAVAGSISNHNPSMAEMALIGEEYAQTPLTDLSGLKASLMPKIQEYIGNAYGRDFKWGVANAEAAYHAYIGMAKDSTDLKTVDSSSGSLWFDKGIFEQVMEGTTGGTLEYGDSKFISPGPGVDNDVIETWAEGLSIGWLVNEGLSREDSITASKGLATQALKLVPVDKGTFYLKDKNGYFMGDGKGGTFKLRYDPEMPIEYKGDFLSREQTDITKEYYGE